MPTHTLTTLSNRDYDDYMSQRLSRLERQAYMIRHLATEEHIRGNSDSYYDYATAPRSHNTRPRRPVSTINNDTYRPTPHDQGNRHVRRRPPSDNTRSHQQQPPTSYQDYPYQTEEHYYHDNPGTSHDHRQRRGRRLRSASVDGRSTRSHIYRDDEDEDDDGYENTDDHEEDHEMRIRAILTRRNTRHNQTIPAQIMDMPLDQSGMQAPAPMVHTVPLVDPVPHTHTHTHTQQQQQQQQQAAQYQQPLPPSQPTQHLLGQQQPSEVQPQRQPTVELQPAVGVTEEQQSGSAVTTPVLSTGTGTSSSTGTASPLKKKKWVWSRFFSSSAAATASSNKQDQRQLSPMPMASTSTPLQVNRGSIWPVNTTGPRGDTISPAEQDEIVRQLPGNNLGTEQKSNATDFTKVADLSYIWVFRAAGMEGTPAANVNVWTTFDYQNQKPLMKHYYTHAQQSMSQPIYDEGIELFDSHIREGQLPVFVFPSRQEAYYATSLTGETVLKLQVSCIPNSKDVQFVYRQPKN